ncbi:OX-2 membrane glycoprotein-like [Mastacembelus armatus]|uniref:OX-2 membrane glycoprotein-like n=1 Tax=Mastacembelus armatus TaxID=205130 RepID=UPI000E4621DB|nr:OX-2 membrane glycoprotein-like [Mastacembelus armatus]
MADGLLLCLLFVLGLFPKCVPAVIQTQQTVVAAVGAEAQLSCQLLQPKDVLQVTWQKMLPEGEKNLATYTTYFGQRVNSGFKDKLEFKEAGLQTCSIVIRNVSDQDEGCYRCLFNTYPDGALTGRTCLQLYELHEPVLLIRESNSTAESVVSCSATGRPAPTVTLKVTQRDSSLSHHNTVRVNNINGTVTVTATAVLSGSHDDSAEVGCAARVPPGPQVEVVMMVPQVKQTPADDFTLIIVLLVVFGCFCAAVVSALLLLKSQNSLCNKDPEKNKTPRKTTKDPDKAQTPLIEQGNELVRQRQSAKKSPQSHHTERSHLTAKCQRQLFAQTQPISGT